MATRRKSEAQAREGARSLSSIKDEMTALQAQIQKLQEEADATRASEVAEVIAKIKMAIAEYGITASDLGLPARPGIARGRSGRGVGRTKGVAEAKFRNAEGQIWGGRGPRPAWLRDALAAGHSLEEFAVRA